MPSASERIDERAEILFLEGEGHGVDGEIPSQLIVLDGAVLDYGIARFAAVGLFPGSHEFNLVSFEAEHGCAEVLEIRYVLAGFLSYGPCEIYPASFDDYVDIVAGASEEAVPDISAYGECAHIPFAGDFTHYAEYLFLNVLGCYCGHC